MTPPDRPGTPDDDLLGQRLREALTPPPEQTERIIRWALAEASAGGGHSARAPRLRRLVPAAALMALLAAVAVFVALHHGHPQQNAVVSIVNVDGMVIATSEEEERPLVLSGAGEQPSSEIILVRHGDPE
jgi:hypothetical protein